MGAMHCLVWCSVLRVSAMGFYDPTWLASDPDLSPDSTSGALPGVRPTWMPICHCFCHPKLIWRASAIMKARVRSNMIFGCQFASRLQVICCVPCVRGTCWQTCKFQMHDISQFVHAETLTSTMLPEVAATAPVNNDGKVTPICAHSSMRSPVLLQD